MADRSRRLGVPLVLVLTMWLREGPEFQHLWFVAVVLALNLATAA